MATKTKRKGRDKPERGRSAMEDEMCEMGNAATRLAYRARLRGYSVAYVIAGYDPISDSSRSVRGYDGDTYQIVGATRAALQAWENDEC